MRDGAFTCGNCQFSEGRHASPEAAARAEEAGHPVPALHCRRYPAPVAKRPDQWCGEHKPIATGGT